MNSMTDETYNGYANRETWAFNLHWQNDQGLYNETLERAGEYLTGEVADEMRSLAARYDDPDVGISDSMLGEYVVAYWRDMIDEWDESEQVPPVLGMMSREVGSWWRIDYAEVGAAVRESLDVES